jgi:hypothetical protein
MNKMLHSAEWQCCYAECHYDTFMLRVITLGVIMLSVTYNPFILGVIIRNVDMLSVVMLSVVVPIRGRIKNTSFFLAYECLK